MTASVHEEAGVTVAAVVPLYNNGHTIIEALDSLLGQTRPVDEIVVVDDGGTDGTADIMGRRFGGEATSLRRVAGQVAGMRTSTTGRGARSVRQTP